MDAFMKDCQAKAKVLVDKFTTAGKRLAEMETEAIKGKYTATLANLRTVIF